MEAKHVAQFRRRREGRTDYKKRLHTLTSGMPRLVVRVTGKRVLVQLVEYSATGDKTSAHATSDEIRGFGWAGSVKNLPSAYLTGFLCAKKAAKLKAKSAVFDIGLHTAIHGSRVFATLAGAVDGGLEIPHDKSVLPNAERISGKHINDKAATMFAAVKEKIANSK